MIKKKKVPNKKTYLTLILFMVLIYGCNDCEYKITNDYIKSNCDFIQGFYLYKIDVDSLDDQNIPITYKVIERISLGLIDNKGKAAKKIFFFQENENYDWYDIKTGKTYATLVCRR
jgi:hypothetical protein